MCVTEWRIMQHKPVGNDHGIIQQFKCQRDLSDSKCDSQLNTIVLQISQRGKTERKLKVRLEFGIRFNTNRHVTYRRPHSYARGYRQPVQSCREADLKQSLSSEKKIEKNIGRSRSFQEKHRVAIRGSDAVQSCLGLFAAQQNDVGSLNVSSIVSLLKYACLTCCHVTQGLL